MPRPAVDPNETPRARFCRVGSDRMKAALDAIRRVEETFAGDVKTYEWIATDLNKVNTALIAAVEKVTVAANSRGKAAPPAGAFFG